MDARAPFLHRLGDSISTLPPACFAFVMASGITALGFKAINQPVISVVLLIAGITGGVLLLVATGWRLARHGPQLLADAKNPRKNFGFFTIVAAANVLGSYASLSGRYTLTIGLAAFSAVVWLFLTYALPGHLLLGRREGSILPEINGSWFLWVVGTQSVATATAILGGITSPNLLAAIAIGLWGIGIALYMIIATLIILQMLVRSNGPASLSPTYWIFMGATAITVLAGSRILLLPRTVPIMSEMSAFVSGLSYLLWSLGLWWIPLLVLFGIWRHGVHRLPMKYETGVWSIVFPLGMYSVASILFGTPQNLTFMVHIGQVGIWVAGVAWLLAVLSMLRAAFTWSVGPVATISVRP